MKKQFVYGYLRRKATENIHTVLRSRWFNDLHPKILHHRNWEREGLYRLTPMMAGSCGIAGGAFSLIGSSMRRSFTSLPRKTICSYTVSDGGYSSLPPLRPSVPKERTLSNETVEASELISTSVPT
jgi:hypothetical protein